jgi:hypothetical protein
MSLTHLGTEFQAPSFMANVQYGLCVDEAGKLWLCSRLRGSAWEPIQDATPELIAAFDYCRHHPEEPFEKPIAPGYWMNETSGVLQPAVEAYLRREPLDEAAIAALRAYLRQWIQAPTWKGGPVLYQLRQNIDELISRDAIDEWVRLALTADIDPF